MRASEFIFEDPASAAGKTKLQGKPGNYYFLTPTGQKLTVGNGFPDTNSAMQWAAKNPQLMSAPAPSAVNKAIAGAKDIGKKVGKKAMLPIAAATEIWDGYTQIKALPTNLDENQYRAEVTKIVTGLITKFGLFSVGALIGGALAGATGPGAIVGGLVGGFVASWVLDDSAQQIIDAIVNSLYNTKNLPAKTGPAEVPAQATKTAPAATGWKAIWDLNRETIKNPNLIYPGQTIKLPNGKPYTVVAGDTLNKIAAANQV